MTNDASACNWVTCNVVEYTKKAYYAALIALKGVIHSKVTIMASYTVVCM